MLASIQLLRAVAAIAVAAFHVQFDLQRYFGLGERLPNLLIGAAGVDLFFVISGFVMVWTSGHKFGVPGAATDFLRRRVIRIVPLYWAVTAVYLAVIVAMPSSGPTYSPADIATSLFFIPALRPDGTIVQPIVGQGWSLNYEMFFYVLFAVALLFKPKVGLPLLLLALAALVSAHFSFELGTVLDFWTAPIVLEFILGLSIGLVARCGYFIPRPAGYCAVMLGLFLLFYPGLPVTDTNRVLFWGLPAAMIVGGLVLGKIEPPKICRSAIILVGDASYALYLLHALCNRAFLMVASKAGLDIGAFVWPVLLLSVGFAIVVSIGAHLIFERPVTKWLRSGRGQTIASTL